MPRARGVRRGCSLQRAPDSYYSNVAGDAHGEPSAATYLDYLTTEDLALLARQQPSDVPGRSQDASEDPVAALRREPARIERLLEDSGVFQAVFAEGERAGDEPLLVRASPFLIFAVAVNRACRELAEANYVNEWAGPRQRIPVFSAEQLHEFLDDSLRRLFLAELLGSYTHVASGTVWVQTPRGPRRRRFSEMDLLRLASMLEVVSEQDQAGVYRRLGDLALFLTGVFPDHTAGRAFRPVDVERLSRAMAAGGQSGAGGEELSEAIETRGPVGMLEHLGAHWYRLAASRSGGSLTGTMRATIAVGEHFSEARRVLNHVADRYLFPFRRQWFPAMGGAP